MPDVHVPKIDPESRAHFRRELWTILLEVVLISGGVFLGIAGEQWRENIHRRALARESLERFRTEIVSNQKAITDVRAYHKDLQRQLQEFIRGKRKVADVEMQGGKPAFL